MKIIILGDSNSSHIIKWVKSLASKGLEILIISLSSIYNEQAYESEKIKIIGLNYSKSTINNNQSLKKLSYLFSIFRIKKIIKQYKPDIIHAHYASSYGTLATLTGFHPFILSVWGSDVFDFPKRSLLNKIIFKHILNKADKILSTSVIMSQEIIKYTNKTVIVTPFGINTHLFSPNSIKTIYKDSDIVIGTIKSLEEVYGIDTLIKTFKILVKKHPQLPLKLLIVGDGTKKQEYETLVKELDISTLVTFIGRINYDDIVNYHNQIDIPVFLSNSESFGVAALEASSCGKPVIASKVGGFTEIIKDNETGILVPPNNPSKAADAIEKLIYNKELLHSMGKAGRERVQKLYEWNDNLEQMINIYSKLV
ncbi:MAG TPA: glycosyltransferase [Bacteroidales bacterium]|jgi:glycosyltransferase involved in cell wall biosynthesis|nr:glycosyltransferase [Bacteroidales bacterium]MDY0161148.1 glycosyltransferase [Bacteroidales bacterium]HXK81440.1 glycosyltransferase [Bacteroidales bacterium]